MYKDIDKKFQSQTVYVTATELATADMNTYYKTLDKFGLSGAVFLIVAILLSRAVMRFHSLKMHEINSIIKELWTSTYKGNG